MKDYNYLMKLKEQNYITKPDRNTIWYMYFKHFGVYPTGKITCGNCILTSFKQLTKYLTLKQILNG